MSYNDIKVLTEDVTDAASLVVRIVAVTVVVIVLVAVGAVRIVAAGGARLARWVRE